MSTISNSRALEDIVRALAAGVRVIVLNTPDEVRALDLLERVASRTSDPLFTWTAASGVDAGGTPIELIELLRPPKRDMFWALLDPGPALADPATARALREAAQRPRGAAFFIIQPPERATWDVPPEAWTLELPPPDAFTLEHAFIGIERVLRADGAIDRAQAVLDGVDALARASLGLEMFAAEQLLASALVEASANPDALVSFIRTHKAARVATAGLLEPATPRDPAELAGTAPYQTWVEQRALALTPAAREAAIDPPRGALLLGVQGCGKSLAARTTAAALDLPLFRLEPGRLFGGTVGRSEANLRRVLAALDAMAPVCLWIDEIDKGFAGTSGARSDAGTSARVMGGLLTWLAEHTRPVFVIATANDVVGLPPELLRRGRLDEIFFFDLPSAQAREQILRVHLETIPARRLGQAPPLADTWPAFAQVAHDAHGFSGAEIEAALTQARLFAFAEQRPLGHADLKRAIDDTVPLSVIRAEEIDALRAWAEHRTRRANG